MFDPETQKRVERPGSFAGARRDTPAMCAAAKSAGHDIATGTPANRAGEHATTHVS
jgi:hypothetical protein